MHVVVLSRLTIPVDRGQYNIVQSPLTHGYGRVDRFMRVWWWRRAWRLHGTEATCTCARVSQHLGSTSTSHYSIYVWVTCNDCASPMGTASHNDGIVDCVLRYLDLSFRQHWQSTDYNDYDWNNNVIAQHELLWQGKLANPLGHWLCDCVPTYCCHGYWCVF